MRFFYKILNIFYFILFVSEIDKINLFDSKIFFFKI